MKILLFSSAYNGLTQRVHRELLQEGHKISIELSPNNSAMETHVRDFKPDIIICPFLKHRVPESIWKTKLCLIVHPGIEGDRGPSSLDWAISKNLTQWGVTLLQADDEMDAGDIWGTQEFYLRNAAKASVYRREVTATAVQLIKQFLHYQFENPNFSPRPLNYKNPDIKGQLLPLMKQENRTINWEDDSTATIVRKINAADSIPGVLISVCGIPVYAYGARAEYRDHVSTPSNILGHKDGALCFATKDGAVWIRQLKMQAQPNNKSCKLPALNILNQEILRISPIKVDVRPISSQVQQDLVINIKDTIAWVTFNFYNGAMSTEQCQRLLSSLRELAQDEQVKVVVLLGGDDFWSNGIHLNTIETAADPARESWRNINAIDDIVSEIINMTNKVTVAALRNNAGAGGAIIPLACDYIFARSGVVLNPHYQTMGLYGSEYWTYLLPKRVGDEIAAKLVNECLPITVNEAVKFGMVDKVLVEDWNQYHELLQNQCTYLAQDSEFDEITLLKQQVRLFDEQLKPLESYRHEELQKMKAIFDNPESDYHRLRHQFVYKETCSQTPSRLINIELESEPEEREMKIA